MARLFFAVALLSGSLLLGGCSLYRKVTGTPPPQDVATSERPPQSLYNFKMGREYAAQGRYELAREQYLIAYAGAENDAVMRDAAAREVQAMDMIIKTQR